MTLECVKVNSMNAEDKIPAETWFQAITPLLHDGHQFRICPQGQSMVPFLRGGRDEAVLSAPDERYQFKKNDIVLFKTSNGLHKLHRICHINKQGIYTLGDGNTLSEGPIQRDDVLAVADYIIRKGRIINNDNRRYLFLISIWRLIRPLRPFILRGYSTIKRLEYRLKRNN